MLLKLTSIPRLKDKGFIFLALNPGWVNTDLAGEGTGSYVST